MNIGRLVILPLLLLGVVVPAWADGIRSDVENTLEYRTAMNVSLKAMKGLKIELEPEFRWADGGLDMFTLNVGVSYKTFGCIYWGLSYRMETDRIEGGEGGYTGLGVYKSHYTETYSRYAVDVTYKDDFGRLTPSLRLRYNNYADNNIDDKSFVRYRAKIVYNIRHCKLTPSISAEGYHETSDIATVYKMRYGAGVELKTSRKGALSLDYTLDYFMLKYKNSHIVSTCYKYKF